MAGPEIPPFFVRKNRADMFFCSRYKTRKQTLNPKPFYSSVSKYVSQRCLYQKFVNELCISWGATRVRNANHVTQARIYLARRTLF